MFLKLVVIVGLVVCASAWARSTEECLYCHDLLNGEVVHEAALFGCDTCHVDHDATSSFPFQLKASMNQLCFDCHETMKFSVDHQGGQSEHPTSGGKDILYPQRDFTCASCHNPHSSNQEHLFRYNYNVAPYKGNLCAVCHFEIAIGYKPPTPPWNE